jgi:hypothetical protein
MYCPLILARESKTFTPSGECFGPTCSHWVFDQSQCSSVIQALALQAIGTELQNITAVLVEIQTALVQQ